MATAQRDETAERRARMIDAAAARLVDGEIVLVGVGLPNVAVSRARARDVPNLRLVFESGAIDAVPPVAPLSIGDPTLVSGSTAAFSVLDVFDFVIRGGRVDTAFVGAAEIDRHARLNSTCIGDYAAPTVRLPGSGGACEIVHHARRVIVISPLQRRRFPARVGFVTSVPGPGTEVCVITDRAVLIRRAGESELQLAELFPGEELASVRAEVGWPLALAPEFEASP